MKTYPPSASEVREYMDLHNLSASWAGKLLGVQPRTIRHWTSGGYVMPFSCWYTLRSRCEGFHMSKDDTSGSTAPGNF